MNLVPIEHHNRLTAGPAAWTDTRVPVDAFNAARAAFGTTSEDDDKRVYRTLQAALHQTPAAHTADPGAYDRGVITGLRQAAAICADREDMAADRIKAEIEACIAATPA